MRRNQIIRLWDSLTSFFCCIIQAFKSYDEAGVSRRVQCLKYLVLASMLMESKVGHGVSLSEGDLDKHVKTVLMGPTENIQHAHGRLPPVFSTMHLPFNSAGGPV